MSETIRASSAHGKPAGLRPVSKLNNGINCSSCQQKNLDDLKFVIFGKSAAELVFME